MCQPATLKGKVITDNGTPVPAATITFKNTNTVTSSAADGTFTIPTPSQTVPFNDARLRIPDTLVVTATGFLAFEMPR